MQIGIESLITGAMIALVVSAYALDYFIAWLRRQQEVKKPRVYAVPPAMKPTSLPALARPKVLPQQWIKPTVPELQTPAPAVKPVVRIEPPAPPKVAGLAALFQNPKTLAHAFILQELLARPRSSRQTRNAR